MLFSPALVEFDKSIIKYPDLPRYPGGDSNDLIPDLQHPKNPPPLLDPNKMPQADGPNVATKSSIAAAEIRR
ncbi:MAG: hypothetical protein WA655_16065 [Candidatus Korobacteraceae bacterium]